MTDQPVALVTGGSRGIGRAICLDLARNGYAVLVNYRTNRSAADQTCAQIAEASGTAHAVRADVTEPDQRQSLLENTLTHFKRIDLLVNNAGVAPSVRKDILETDPAIFHDVLTANLYAPYFLTQLVAKHMIAQLDQKSTPPGKIVNISSIRAYTAATNYGEYCISKAGLSMVTRLFANRLAPYGINVYEIRPGVIETDMTSKPEVQAYYNQFIGQGMTPIDRWGQPDDVAKAVTAIATDYFPFSTGEVFNVDGGWHLRSL